MEQEVVESLAPMEREVETEPLANERAQRKAQAQKSTHKELQFDARYGWTYDQYFDPVELAYSGGRGRFAIGPLLAASFQLTVAMIAVLEEVSSSYAVRGLKYTRKAAAKATSTRLLTSKTPVSKQHHKRKGPQTPLDTPGHSKAGAQREAASTVNSVGALSVGGNFTETPQSTMEETVQVGAEAREEEEEQGSLNTYSGDMQEDEGPSVSSTPGRVLNSGLETRRVAEGSQGLDVARALEDAQRISLARREVVHCKLDKESEHSPERLNMDIAKAKHSILEEAASIPHYKGPVQPIKKADEVEVDGSHSEDSGSRRLDEGVDERGSIEDAFSVNSALILSEGQEKQRRGVRSQELMQQGKMKVQPSTEKSRKEELRTLSLPRREMEEESEATVSPLVLGTDSERSRELHAFSGRERSEPPEMASVTIWSITEGFDKRSLKMLAKQASAGRAEKYSERSASKETHRQVGRGYRASEVPHRLSREQVSYGSGPGGALSVS